MLSNGHIVDQGTYDELFHDVGPFAKPMRDKGLTREGRLRKTWMLTLTCRPYLTVTVKAGFLAPKAIGKAPGTGNLGVD